MHTATRTRELNGGMQYVFRFDNGYGASLIRGGTMAYGGLELAVVTYDDGADDYDYHLTYSTPLTDDVIGYLKEQDVMPLLDRIAELPPSHAH